MNKDCTWLCLSLQWSDRTFEISDHVFLKWSIRSSALPCSTAVWLAFRNSDHVALKLSIRSSALPRSAAVRLAFWNSDLVALKSSIRTSASPRQQRSHWGLRVTQDAYFSLLTHTKQLLLVTFCYTSAGIQASFRTQRRTNGGRTDGRTDRRGSRNSFLDFACSLWSFNAIFFPILQWFWTNNV